MSFSIESYKKDIELLVKQGDRLYSAMLFECKAGRVRKEYSDEEKYNANRKRLPNFREEYQSWYSEAKALVKQLLPDRLDDLVRYYEKPKSRKYTSSENYRIEDYLQGLEVKSILGSMFPDTSAALPHFQQQLAIVKALSKRFASSLYDIRLHLQAEMFDDELDAATYLLKKKFVRASGAMAGVVLERHLRQVCINHQVSWGTKKNPTISDFNDGLKNSNVIDTLDWRRIQFLGDIRNKCDHDKKDEPTEIECSELIEGVKRVMKNIF